MNKEELDLQLEQKLPSTISFESSYKDLAEDVEGEPPCFGWSYSFVQGNLVTYIALTEKVLPKLPIGTVDKIVLMIKDTLMRGQVDKQLQGV